VLLVERTHHPSPLSMLCGNKSTTHPNILKMCGIVQSSHLGIENPHRRVRPSCGGSLSQSHVSERGDSVEGSGHLYVKRRMLLQLSTHTICNCAVWYKCDLCVIVYGRFMTGPGVGHRHEGEPIMEYVEPESVVDTVVTGIAKIEDMGDGMVRIWLYADESLTEKFKVIRAKLVFQLDRVVTLNQQAADAFAQLQRARKPKLRVIVN
jgi:hypothetical protein